MNTSKRLIAPAALIAATIAFGMAPSAFAQDVRDFATDNGTVRASVVASGLEHPWALGFLPEGRIIVTERAGRMRIVSADGTLSDPVANVPKVWASGQGGLLDVAVSPDFAATGTIYFTFSEPGRGGAGTAIASARLAGSGSAYRLEDVRVLYSMPRKTSRGQHFGSRIVLHPDGSILFTTGDRGQGPRAQDMGDAAGAVLRINPDGTVPADNPYANGQGGALPQIWSKGHRNPQGFAIDSAGTLWTVEHGARGGDEVNNPEAGKNYGWPEISYGRNYTGTRIGVGSRAPGYEQPVHYWDPSIAPSGLVVYEGDLFPEWRGDLIVGALRAELLSRLDRDETGRIVGEERILEGEFGRIRDVRAAPDGAIWFVTDEARGRLVRLTPAD